MPVITKQVLKVGNSLFSGRKYNNKHDLNLHLPSSQFSTDINVDIQKCLLHPECIFYMYKCSNIL